ncbi:MAG TPA: hypothetical protein PKE16_10105, partial [Hyphomicrobium sp.]|nr:hypothetical protein [Hyphomicrobium sp.]
GAQTPAGGVRPVTDEGADMAINRRLPTKADAEGDEAPRTARGWGRPATEEDEAPRQTQRAAISSKLRGRDVEEEEGNKEEEAPRPSSRFSGGLRDRMAGSDAGEDAPEEADKPEPRTRARAVGRAVEADAVPPPPLNTAQTAGEQQLYVHVAINVSGPQELIDEYLRKIAG